MRSLAKCGSRFVRLGGSITFEVFANATKVYDSGVMTGSSQTAQVDVSIAGASQLRLGVLGGGDGIDYDHGDWANARVECGSGGGDTTPPTLTGTSPPAGASGVSVDTSTSATFSEAMDPATLTTSTISLVRQGESDSVSASITYFSGSLTATFDPSSSLLATKDLPGDGEGRCVGSEGSRRKSPYDGRELELHHREYPAHDKLPVRSIVDAGDERLGSGRTRPLERRARSRGRSNDHSDGTTYGKGLGVHAASEVRYSISDCSRLKADVGVDNEVTVSLGTIVFEVYVGGGKVYDSGVMNAASAT